MESLSISPAVENVIRKMDDQGKFILGMCSGFQVLSNKTDIGRKSPCPVEREGLGMLDVTFHPLIGNDRVEAKVMDDSFLTKGMVGGTVTGFHCHTYGEIRGDALPLFFSEVKRTDYKDNPRKILSGVRNDEGNVVGTMVHASLDENPQLVENTLKFIDASENDIQKIKLQNKELVLKIKREIGIGWDIYSGLSTPTSLKPSTEHFLENHQSEIHLSEISSSDIPPFLMIASTGSDSGKTFLTTGLVGALRRRGYRIAVLKVGPDIRDLVPALYLNKEKMEKFSSIQIGGLGWKDLEATLQEIKDKNYDLILIEGVMSIFTGLLNEKTPFSAAEIAKAGNIPTLMVTGCNKGGIETAAIDLASHTATCKKMGINVTGVILNKVYNQDIANTASEYLIRTEGIDWVGQVPKAQLAARGGTPEVEIKLEDFCLKAMETVEEHLDIKSIFKMARKPEFTGYLSYHEILENFNQKRDF